MKTLILCGGRGTRLNGERPKPLIEIAGRPIVWHVEAWARGADWPDSVRVACVDTGLDTPTGGRVHAIRDRLEETFCLTYADGVADIDLRALLGHHRSSGAWPRRPSCARSCRSAWRCWTATA